MSLQYIFSISYKTDIVIFNQFFRAIVSHKMGVDSLYPHLHASVRKLYIVALTGSDQGIQNKKDNKIWCTEKISAYGVTTILH